MIHKINFGLFWKLLCIIVSKIFDAIIITASFCLDVAFLEGPFGAGDETAVLLIVFLLWRLLRVVNGESLWLRMQGANECYLNHFLVNMYLTGSFPDAVEQPLILNDPLALTCIDCIGGFLSGLMVTSKKRQEFRLKLQKSSRRKAEKRAEMLEEERQCHLVGHHVIYMWSWHKY